MWLRDREPPDMMQLEEREPPREWPFAAAAAWENANAAARAAAMAAQERQLRAMLSTVTP